MDKKEFPMGIKKISSGKLKKTTPEVMVAVEPVKYDPVDKSKKPSVIFIERYCITRGIMMRDLLSSETVAYCKESPKEVLKEIFPDYHVTSFEGYRFFDSVDFDPTTPLRGIGICGTDKFSGIEGIVVDGRITKLLELKRLTELRRDEPISEEQVKKIIKYVSEENSLRNMSKGYKQWKYDVAQISKTLRDYLKR